jgi:hypothetical protein
MINCIYIYQHVLHKIHVGIYIQFSAILIKKGIICLFTNHALSSVEFMYAEWPTEFLQVLYGASLKFRNLESEFIKEYREFLNIRMPC